METKKVFDWPAPLAANNVFSKIQLPDLGQWDISRLYTSGEIRLVPEPTTGTLCVCLLLLSSFLYRRQQ